MMPPVQGVSASQGSQVNSAQKWTSVRPMTVRMEHALMNQMTIDATVSPDTVEHYVKSTLMTVHLSRAVAEETVWTEFRISLASVSLASRESSVREVGVRYM